MNNCAWRGKSKKNDKPWGYEIVWGALPAVHGKILVIEKGKRTSFKYYERKNEVLHILRGKAHIKYGDQQTLIDEISAPYREQEFAVGDVLFIQNGSPYRITAIEECEIIEIGDNSSNSVVRLDDDYGRST